MPWFTVTAKHSQYYQFDVEAEDIYEAEELAGDADWGRPMPFSDDEDIILIEKTNSHDGDEPNEEE